MTNHYFIYMNTGKLLGYEDKDDINFDFIDTLYIQDYYNENNILIDDFSENIKVRDPDIKQIYTNNENTFILRNNQDLIVHGTNNDYGQMEDYDCYEIPQIILKNKRITKIANSNLHTLAYSEHTNKLYVFGSNCVGQLGLYHCEDICDSKVLTENIKIRDIYCGSQHSMFLTHDYELYVFGSNSVGELGLGHRDDVYIPTLLMKNDNIKHVICSITHSMILMKTGELFGFGYNKFGVLGVSDKILLEPVMIMNDPRIIQVASGSYHTLILKDNGELWVVASCTFIYIS